MGGKWVKLREPAETQSHSVTVSQKHRDRYTDRETERQVQRERESDRETERQR